MDQRKQLEPAQEPHKPAEETKIVGTAKPNIARPLIHNSPQRKKRHYIKIFICGNSRSGKSSLIRQLAQLYGETVIVYEGPTTRIVERRVVVPVNDFDELELIVVDTPGFEDSAHPDAAIQVVYAYLLDTASRYAALSLYDRERSDLLVNVVLLASGAHMKNSVLFEAAKVTTQFAPTIFCALKADAYGPQEADDYLVAIGQLMQAAGVNLWVPPGINVGYKLLGEPRQNIGGNPLDPMAPNSPFQNRQLWDYINHRANMADLITESETRALSVIRSRGVIRRIGDKLGALKHNPLLQSVLVLLLAIVLIYALKPYFPDWGMFSRVTTLPVRSVAGNSSAGARGGATIVDS